MILIGGLLTLELLSACLLIIIVNSSVARNPIELSLGHSLLAYHTFINDHRLLSLPSRRLRPNLLDCCCCIGLIVAILDLKLTLLHIIWTRGYHLSQAKAAWGCLLVRSLRLISTDLVHVLSLSCFQGRAHLGQDWPFLSIDTTRSLVTIVIIDCRRCKRCTSKPTGSGLDWAQTVMRQATTVRLSASTGTRRWILRRSHHLSHIPRKLPTDKQVRYSLIPGTMPWTYVALATAVISCRCQRGLMLVWGLASRPIHVFKPDWLCPCCSTIYSQNIIFIKRSSSKVLFFLKAINTRWSSSSNLRSYYPSCLSLKVVLS